jgi:4'-phosphopantetheinyl transferase
MPGPLQQQWAEFQLSRRPLHQALLSAKDRAGLEEEIRLRNLRLTENQVDIWSIHLCGEEWEMQQCRRLLSPDEVQRADRFYFEKHRRRFTRARAAMRQILSGYSRVPPEELTFSYGQQGKPQLAGKLESCGVRFNLSHTEEMALLAVTQNQDAGIDIESVNSEFATEEIAERFFSAGEVLRLNALPVAEKADAFFACWTRKEAYIKAVGGGLSVPLDSFEVAFGPGVAPALLLVKGEPNEMCRWSMYEVKVTQGYRAALVVEGRGHVLRHLQWESGPLSWSI